MPIRLKPGIKILLVFLFFAASVYGFMIKLPPAFRHSDKGMHAAYYFLAAAFLNLLFVGRNLIKHILVSVFLYLFGMGIEYAQEYSNTYFRKRIHGRYDPEDLAWNLKGLLAFSVLWVVVVLLSLALQKTSRPEKKA